MKDVHNRVPSRPNRVKVTPEGGTPFFATVERADEPIVEGTPLDRDLFLSIKEGDWYTPGVGEIEMEAGNVPGGNGIVDCTFWNPFSKPPFVLVWADVTETADTTTTTVRKFYIPANVTAFGFQSQAGARYLAVNFTGRDTPA